MNEERKPIVEVDHVGALTQIIRTLQLVWRLMKDPRVPTFPKLIIPAVVLYVISPIDLLPDFILGLGQVDDIAVLFFGIGFFIELCPPYVVEEHRRALAGYASGTDHAQEEVVEGTYRVMPDDGEKRSG